MAERARQLCKAQVGATTRLEGELVHLAGVDSPSAQAEQAMRAFFPVERQLAPANIRHALARREPYQITDVRLEPGYPDVAAAERMGVRSILSVPLLHDGRVIGTIGVARGEPGRFSDEAVALLQTFARQAVIAIENVRLFNETKEAPERQTATSDILRVISSSPTDVQPVFDAIVGSAVRLCGGLWGTLYRRYDDMVDSVASWNVPAEVRDVLRHGFPRPVGTGASPHFHRALVEGMVATIRNVETDPELSPRVRAFCRQHGLRSVVMVPLRGRREILCALVVGHRQVEAFSDSHTSLLQTFADQAVIAIENVRLFTELQTSNRELTTALDTQTATSDILRVISRSQTDVQPVFDAIIGSAVRLLRADVSVLTRVAGNQLELAALTHTGGDAAVRAVYPLPLDSEWPHVRSVRDRVPLNIVDTETDPRIPESLRAVARAGGLRGLVTVAPLQREAAVGGR